MFDSSDFPGYRAPWLFRNGHVSTIYVGLCRKAGPDPYLSSRRLTTPDGDFLDIDLALQESNQLVILLHGLEGNTRRPYMIRMASRLLAAGVDVVALNFRGCSHEPNQILRSYHTGETGDLRFLIQWVEENFNHQNIALVGFSLGGNVLLKYLGEEGRHTSPRVSGGVAFSAPVHLASSSHQLDQGINRLYVYQFLRTLIPKALAKLELFDHELDREAIRSSGSFAEFDQAFTAPVNGFTSAEDYWDQASSLPWLHKIERPTLLINAVDDPFLGPACYPADIARQHPFLTFEAPENGGHLAFPSLWATPDCWSENRTAHFLSTLFAVKG
ncbi:MAG: alpha/beta fold hydrolase [Saprospiraceae bacterium]|nr:alpha/beta fold hydrolase [Saprospiraceae bacterium]